MTVFLLALAISGLLTGALLPLLHRWRLYDVPNDRSSHGTVTPRGGGIALMFAVVIAVAVVVSLRDESDRSSLLLVLAPAALLATVGLADDVRSLGSTTRLLLQVGTALGTATGALSVLGDAGWGAVVFVSVSTAGVVAYVNAFNFMDGVNGMSSLTATVCGAWFAWLGADRDVASLVVVGAALAGASLGFLPWNLRSRVFLGDVGSYGVGALISVAVVVGWAAGVSLGLLLAPLLVYLADTGWVLAKKIPGREPLTQAHRSHVYQRLVALGWPHVASAAWTAALAAVCCLVAAVTVKWGSTTALLSACCLASLHLAAPRLAARRAPREEPVT